MKIHELMINLGDCMNAARQLMNGIDSYRQERQNIEHDLSEMEKYIERAIYSAARRLLRSTKRILEGYGKMRGPGLADFNRELQDLLDQVEVLEGELTGSLGEPVGKVPDGGG